MNLARVFAEAAGLWRHDRDLWIRVAGFFFFLPALALYWFAPVPELKGLDPDAAQKLTAAWFDANALGLLGIVLFITFGYGVALTLLLDDKRPALGTAIVRALRLLPALALVSFVVGLAVGVGLIAAIIPGLYIAGRTFLAFPALAADPGRGPFAALVAAVRHSHQRGWMLAIVMMSAIFTTQLAASVIAATATAAGATTGGSEPLRLVFAVLLAAVAASGALAQALLQAAAYRALDGTRQGI